AIVHGRFILGEGFGALLLISFAQRLFGSRSLTKARREICGNNPRSASSRVADLLFEGGNLLVYFPDRRPLLFLLDEQFGAPLFQLRQLDFCIRHNLGSRRYISFRASSFGQSLGRSRLKTRVVGGFSKLSLILGFQKLLIKSR